MTVVLWIVLTLCDCGHVLVHSTTCIAKEAESNSVNSYAFIGGQYVKVLYSVPSGCSVVILSAASMQYDE